MIFIGDVHATSLVIDKILEKIENFVKSKKDKHIVYMWDFVYHFNYDRKSILKIFDQMIKFSNSWYQIDVLAWNHDYIQDSYIFAQSEKILWKEWKIRFHTSPFETSIKTKKWEKKVLMLPFNFSLDTEPSENFLDLYNSQNRGEHLSWVINSIVEDFVKKYESDDKILIHHYYFADIVFPGQKSFFSYKDIALSPIWLEQKKLQIFSGHIHRSFKYQNYFCTWSIWATNTIEENHDKFLFHYDENSWKISWDFCNINRFVRINKKEFENFDEKILEKVLENQYKFQSENVLPWVNISKENYELQNIKLTFVSNQNEDFEYKNYVSESLLSKIWWVNVKKVLDENNLITISNDDKTNLQQNLSDWKKILKDYIYQKYPNADEYIALLQKLDIEI